jgi:YVTN family beta-propeller protein
MRRTFALLGALAWGAEAQARAPVYVVVDSASTYSQPKAVVLSPDETRAYVTNFGRRHSKNLSVFDAQTLEETGVVEFEGNGVEIVVTRDGRTLYTSNFSRHVVDVVDTESLDVVAEIPVGHNPKTMAISADERTLYVSNWSSDDVSVVDLVQRTETRRIAVGHHPRGIAVSASGVLIVGNHAEHTLSFFDTSTFEALRDDVACGRFPRHVVLSPDDGYAYVSSQGSAAVFRVDVASGEVLEHWYGGRNLKTIAVTDDGRYVFTAAFGAAEVVAIDTEDGTSRSFAVAGIEKPCGLDVTGDGRRVYVTGWDNYRLYALQRRDEED